MNGREALRARIDAVPDPSPDSRECMELLYGRYVGMSEAYSKLQKAHEKVVDQSDSRKVRLNEARLRAEAMVQLMLELLVQAQTSPMDDAEYRRHVVERLLPLALAAGHSYMGDGVDRRACPVRTEGR